MTSSVTGWIIKDPSPASGAPGYDVGGLGGGPAIVVHAVARGRGDLGHDGVESAFPLLGQGSQHRRCTPHDAPNHVLGGPEPAHLHFGAHAHLTEPRAGHHRSYRLRIAQAEGRESGLLGSAPSSQCLLPNPEARSIINRAPYGKRQAATEQEHPAHLPERSRPVVIELQTLLADH